mmetsp:Transcript_67456/g.158890  ORF Transcript_67456/g.158890 Transcript_67456/m.158890 type:complete len:106 (+) Transcript_67456:28-345(+)
MDIDSHGECALQARGCKRFSESTEADLWNTFQLQPPPVTTSNVLQLLLMAEEHQLPRLRHCCEDFLLCQAPDDLRGLQVAQRFSLGRLEERYRKRYAGGTLRSEY